MAKGRRRLEVVCDQKAMAYNTIEFQHGMSIPEFFHSFGTEAQCAAAVTQAR